MPRPTVVGPIPNPDGSSTTVTTKTTFHRNGSTKTVERVVLDANGKVVELTKEKFKKGAGPGVNGRSVGKFTSNTNLTARPPKRVTVTIQYCPDGTIEKRKVTRVYYKAENRWHEQTREKKTVKRSCKTGEVIAFAFPQGLGDYALIALAVILLIVPVLGWSNGEKIYWLIELIALIAAFLLYRNHQNRRIDQEISELTEFYDVMNDENERPDFVEDAIEQEPESETSEQPGHDS